MKNGKNWKFDWTTTGFYNQNSLVPSRPLSRISTVCSHCLDAFHLYWSITWSCNHIAKAPFQKFGNWYYQFEAYMKFWNDMLHKNIFFSALEFHPYISRVSPFFRVVDLNEQNEYSLHHWFFFFCEAKISLIEGVHHFF